MSECLPTAADLAERARRIAESYPGVAHSGLRSDLADFADRLAELAALEPVGELLAEARQISTRQVIRDFDVSFIATAVLSGRAVSGQGPTILAALAALAEQVRGRA